MVASPANYSLGAVGCALAEEGEGVRMVAGLRIADRGEDVLICGRCLADMDPERGYDGGAGVVRVRDRRGRWAATFVCDSCASSYVK